MVLEINLFNSPGIIAKFIRVPGVDPELDFGGPSLLFSCEKFGGHGPLLPGSTPAEYYCQGCSER